MAHCLLFPLFLMSPTGLVPSVLSIQKVWLPAHSLASRFRPISEELGKLALSLYQSPAILTRSLPLHPLILENSLRPACCRVQGTGLFFCFCYFPEVPVWPWTPSPLLYSKRHFLSLSLHCSTSDLKYCFFHTSTQTLLFSLYTHSLSGGGVCLLAALPTFKDNSRSLEFSVKSLKF